MLSEADRLLGDVASLGVIALDLDHFKAVNDQYGHDVGDEALRHVVDVTRRVVRSGDIIARRSGEEFVVMLPNADPAVTAQAAERIRAAIAADPASVDGVKIPITVSIGAVHDDVTASTDFEILLRTADERLYEAKREGRNRAVFV